MMKNPYLTYELNKIVDNPFQKSIYSIKTLKELLTERTQQLASLKHNFFDEYKYQIDVTFKQNERWKSYFFIASFRLFIQNLYENSNVIGISSNSMQTYAPTEISITNLNEFEYFVGDYIFKLLVNDFEKSEDFKLMKVELSSTKKPEERKEIHENHIMHFLNNYSGENVSYFGMMFQSNRIQFNHKKSNYGY